MLLDTASFVSWLETEIQAELGPLPAPRRAIGAGGCPIWLSAGATLCGFFKCTFGGGIANFMCVACTGIALACAIADLYVYYAI